MPLRNRLFSSVITCTAIVTSIFASQPPKTIAYNGKAYYINGINVPWNSFGSDIGTHYQWGALYSPSFFTTFFQACKSYGVNCVRLWIHCDGRSSPEFDDNGFVIGLDTNFLSNFDDLLKIAASNNVMVMPCLWSFDMTKDYTADAGKYAGKHADLIQDSAKTRSYINKALIPMVSHLANTCNLFAWEIINEPEWSIKGPGTTPQQVDSVAMQRFCAMIAEAIHANSNKMVTVGSACLKWCSSRQPPAVAQYWSDSAFKKAYNKPKAVLDFYQIHYYDWMFNADWGYDPFQTTKTPAYWNLDKPTIIGECPGTAGKYTVKQMVDAAFANGYAGIMPWSYNAKDGYGTWDECKTELKAFRDAHQSLVDFSCPPSSVTEGSVRNSARPHAHRLTELLGRSDQQWQTLKVFDARGALVKTFRRPCKDGLLLLKTNGGVLYCHVLDEENRSICSGAILSTDLVKVLLPP